MPRFFARFVILSLLISVPCWSATELKIAVISDGPYQQDALIENIMIAEMMALTEGEFKVTTQRFEANWSIDSINGVLDSAYTDPSIDMLLVTGIAANQIAVVRAQYPKPTFLPVVFDIELMGAPFNDNTSGKNNLNYISSGVDFKQNLDNFLRLGPLKKIALLSDQLVVESVPRVRVFAQKIAKEKGIELVFISHNGSDHDLAAAIPADVEGVMLATFPRMPDDDYLAMIDNINTRRLPSFSLLGSDRVARGILFTDAPTTDWQRLARRNALNMQAVMLGENAADQQVVFESKYELTLNMATARKIGFSPSFDLLSEAVLLNELPESRGPTYTLASVAQTAIARNLLLNAESVNLLAGEQNINAARANLLPQVSLSSRYLQRKKSLAVQSGQLAERTADGSATLSQLIYADDAWANLEIQRQLQANRTGVFQQTQLDTIQASTIAFLNVLRAQTQLTIQQDNLNLTKTNLELARDRVRVGASSAADVYRWESRIASDRASLLQANVTLKQAQENLNRLLNRPIDEAFQTGNVSKGDPFVMTPDEFEVLINNPRRYGFFTDYILQIGFDLSPELQQIEAQIAAKEREKTNLNRSFWLPDFSLDSRYGENFNQSGLGAGLGENQSDWDVAINASIPLFDGGSRRADLARVRLELKQLSLVYNATREQIEQQIRATLHQANASYITIDLSAQAAEAGQKNLELVTDSYAQGLVSVIELLDAQNSSLQADEAAANAVYDFLIDIMDMQRAIGQFEFLLGQDEQQQLNSDIRDYINTRSATQR